MNTTLPNVRYDQQGLACTASAAAVDALNAAISDYFGWTGDPIKQLSQAAQYDPQCALAHTSLATIYMLNGVRGDAPEVTAAIACASKLSGGISEREQKTPFGGTILGQRRDHSRHRYLGKHSD